MKRIVAIVGLNLLALAAIWATLYDALDAGERVTLARFFVILLVIACSALVDMHHTKRTG